jgi:hypothetical protein
MKKLFILPLTFLLFVACGEAEEKEISETKCSCEKKLKEITSKMEQEDADDEAIAKEIEELDAACNEAANKDKAAFKDC